MNKDLGNYRKSYEKSALEEKNIPRSPIVFFEKWFKEVEDFGGVEEANAMTLTTINADGFPKSRIVLLKEYNEQGFMFYTNYSSEKGKDIKNMNKVCLSFFWPNLERQVIIRGTATKLPEHKSLAYFSSRPRGSQLGAWASDQSEVITSRAVLEENLVRLEKEYEGKEIPKPPFWGGYLIRPVTFEFWQGRPNRLHDRIHFTLLGDDWKIERLSP